MFRTPEHWVVQLGKYERHEIVDGTSTIQVWVNSLIIHEAYDDYSSDNDIAVLILGHSIEVSDTINMVALNPVEESKRKKFDSKSECYITGWGLTEGMLLFCFL